jgi:putative ABC transport system substrate-binding protein
LVASLARPGGNITGFTDIAPDLAGKRLELLKEAVPKAARVAMLWSTNPVAATQFKQTTIAARPLRVQLQSLEVRGPNPDLESAFQAAGEERAEALIVVSFGGIINHQERIVNLATKNRLPAMYTISQFVHAGGLMSYAPDGPDRLRRAAIYVDKILKGAKPAELPVEQPKKFELIINLKAAKQIGLTIPPNVLARADKVIR